MVIWGDIGRFIRSFLSQKPSLATILRTASCDAALLVDKHILEIILKTSQIKLLIF